MLIKSSSLKFGLSFIVVIIIMLGYRHALTATSFSSDGTTAQGVRLGHNQADNDIPPQPSKNYNLNLSWKEKKEDDELSAVISRNRNRRLEIAKECKNIGTPQNGKIIVRNIRGNELIENEHNILYCSIPKVGSTFWKKVLKVLATNGKYSSPFEVRNYGLPSIKSYLKTHDMPTASEFNATTSFMFVRNPYARLYSGYVNKIYNPNLLFWKSTARKTAITIRHSDENIKYANDITFREFVQFVLHRYKNNENIDHHFKPMSMQCDACAIPYTFIGHLETLKEDAKYLLNKWRSEFPDFKFKFDDFERESANDTVRSRVRNLFRIREKLGDKEFPVYNMSVRVWCDLQIRGYLSKHSRFPFSKNDITTVTEEMYVAAVMHGLETRKDISAIKNQRTEAYIQAYHTIPLNEMRQLREYLLKDCTLFGYDCKPKELFDRELPFTVDHLYLDGI